MSGRFFSSGSLDNIDGLDLSLYLMPWSYTHGSPSVNLHYDDLMQERVSALPITPSAETHCGSLVSLYDGMNNRFAILSNENGVW
jgi:hypothetical protein